MQKTIKRLSTVALTLVLATAAAFADNYTDGIEYYKSGQPERAKIILTNTLNASGTDKAVAYYYLGESEYQLGDKEAAAKYFKDGIKANAENPYNYVGEGKMLLATNADAADDMFKTAIKLAKKLGLNAEVYTAIAQAYFQNNNAEYRKSLDRAKKFNDRLAEIYVLEGDIALKGGDTGTAAGMYEMAIMYDQKCIEAYVKYALMHYPINSKYATTKLETLLDINPESAIGQRELAEAYFNAGRFSEAVKAYAIYMANPNRFESDLSRHGALLFFDKKYDESLAIVKAALQTNPDDFIANRFAMYNSSEMQDYEAVVEYGNNYIYKPENKKFVTSQDFIVLGNALKELGRNQEYVTAIETAISNDSTKVAMYKELSSAYKELGYLQKSAEALELYTNKKEEGQTTMDFFVLGRAFYSAATAAADSIASDIEDVKIANPAKSKLYQATDSVFAIVVEKVPEDYRGYLWRARANSGLDPETEIGLAKPYYEMVIEILEPEHANTKNSSLIEAYRYLGYFNYLKEYEAGSSSYPETKKWWGKVVDCDPNNSLKGTLEQLNQ